MRHQTNKNRWRQCAISVHISNRYIGRFAKNTPMVTAAIYWTGVYGKKTALNGCFGGKTDNRNTDSGKYQNTNTC